MSCGVLVCTCSHRYLETASVYEAATFIRVRATKAIALPGSTYFCNFHRRLIFLYTQCPLLRHPLTLPLPLLLQRERDHLVSWTQGPPSAGLDEHALLLSGCPHNRPTPCPESPPFCQNPILCSESAVAFLLWTSPPAAEPIICLLKVILVSSAADLCVGHTHLPYQNTGFLRPGPQICSSSVSTQGRTQTHADYRM